MARTIAVNGCGFVIQPEMEQKATATGLWADATGLTNGIGFFAATKGGTAIDGTLSIALSASEAQLASLVGTTVWLCKMPTTTKAQVNAEVDTAIDTDATRLACDSRP